VAANTDAPLAAISSGNADLFAAHRRGYQDAMARRDFPPQYETWQRDLQLNYELGRARYCELKGIRGKGVRWRPDEKLITAVARALGRNRALRFNLESLTLFNEEKGRS
jgi:membrane-bound lytic murein transglycosylase MltF